MSRPFVRVLGVALAVSACQKTPPELPGNPPVPDPIPEVQNGSTGLGSDVEAVDNSQMPEPDPRPYGNPPSPRPGDDPGRALLPTWDSVKSGHPEGATNPPSPVLVVTREPLACYKDWMGGMMPPPADVRQAGGRVVATAADVGSRATQVQCPEGQPEQLLEAYATVVPEQAPR